MSVSPPFVDRRRALPGDQPARHVVEAVFPRAKVSYVEGWPEIADLFDRMEDQRPATCGAYAARYLLAPLGFAKVDRVDTTREDYLAHLAGTVIEDAELEEVRAVGAQVEALGLSDAQAIKQFPRNWYGWPLRSSDDDVVAGTSPTGTARAIAVGSGGALVTLPIPGRDPAGAVAMSPERFNALIDLLERHLDDWGVHPIANLEVDQLLDSTSDAYTPATLAGADPEASIPREHWGVGHFVGVGAFWRAEDGRRWVLLLDTYKARGFNGYVPMPAESLRRAVVREDGRNGGLLLVMRRASSDAAREAMEALGLGIPDVGQRQPRTRRLGMVDGSMIWLPEFDDVIERAWGSVDGFDGLRVDDPQAGRIDGATAFDSYRLWADAWLRDRRARPRPIATTVDATRVVGEYVVELTEDRRTFSLPVAIAVEPGSERRDVWIRIYHSQWPLLGHHVLRPPLLSSDPSVRESDVVGEYQAALAAGDTARIVATFEPDGCFREPAGGEFRVCGASDLTEFFRRFFGAGGGIVLEHCTVTEDRTRTALEFNAVRWGGVDLPPQAGIAVYERGPAGKIAEARVYDDVEGPVE